MLAAARPIGRQDGPADSHRQETAMPIRFACDCGRSLEIDDKYAGKRARCPACKAAVAVPVPEPEPDDCALELVEEEESGLELVLEDDRAGCEPSHQEVEEDPGLELFQEGPDLELDEGKGGAAAPRDRANKYAEEPRLELDSAPHASRAPAGANKYAREPNLELDRPDGRRGRGPELEVVELAEDDGASEPAAPHSGRAAPRGAVELVEEDGTDVPEVEEVVAADEPVRDIELELVEDEPAGVVTLAEGVTPAAGDGPGTPGKGGKKKRKPKLSSDRHSPAVEMYLQQGEAELRRDAARVRPSRRGAGEGLTIGNVHITAGVMSGAGLTLVGLLCIAFIAFFHSIGYLVISPRIWIGAIGGTAIGLITLIKSLFFGVED
jgi:hypothetical protein